MKASEIVQGEFSEIALEHAHDPRNTGPLPDPGCSAGIGRYTPLLHKPSRLRRASASCARSSRTHAKLSGTP